MVWPPFSLKNLLDHFFVWNGYCNALSELSADLWWYKITWRIPRTPHVLCKALPAHIERLKCHLFSGHSDDLLISLDYCKRRGISIDWPPYSTYLTQFDFFLCVCVREEYLKDEAYRQKLRKISELLHYISAVCVMIQALTLILVSASCVFRLLHVVPTNAGYIENIVI